MNYGKFFHMRLTKNFLNEGISTEVYYLGLMNKVAPLDFERGKPIGLDIPVPIKVYRDGRVSKFFAVGSCPTMIKEYALEIQKFAGSDIQIFPVYFIGKATPQELTLLNVTALCDCFEKYGEIVGDPDPYNCELKVAIDSSRVDGKHIFRVRGFEAPVIVSEALKRHLDSLQLTDIEFEPLVSI